MNLLAKIHLITLKCLIFTWVSYWVTLCWDQVVVALRFYDPLNPHCSDPAFKELGRLSFIALVSLGLGWKYFVSKEDQFKLPPFIWNALCKQYPILALLRVLLLLSTGFIILFMSHFFASCSINHMMSPLAYLADQFKNYELAEQIYKRYEYRQSDVAFASWRGSFVPEDKSAISARNIAVAKVYGENSLEMIERYLSLGRTIDLSSGGAYPEKANQWFKKALSLAVSRQISDKAFYALYYMALVKNEEKLIHETAELVKQASNQLSNDLDLSSFGKRRMFYYRLSLDIISVMAHQSGDSASEKVFLSQRDKVNRFFSQNNENRSIIPAIVLHDLLLIALALSIGPIPGLANIVLLSRLYNQTEKKLSQSRDVSSRLDSLNIMMAIDLYSQNFKRAWEHSVNSLKLVGIDTTHLSKDFAGIITGSTLKAVLYSQIHATVFILFFFAFFAFLWM